MRCNESLANYYLKQLKPWFNEECSELLYKRKQGNLQWLQDPCQKNSGNADNVRFEAVINFRTEMNFQSKESEMDGACSAHRVGEKCLQNFGWKA